MSLENVFASPGIERAFARAQKLLGEKAVKLADGRTVYGVVDRFRRIKTMDQAGYEALTDFAIVCTKPQFDGVIPEPKTMLTLDGKTYRIEAPDEDETHVSLHVVLVI